MRIGQANAPGKPLTGLTPDSRRVDDYALLRGFGTMEERVAALEAKLRAQNVPGSDSARNLRLHSRDIMDTDTLDTRTVDPADLIVYLLGAGGVVRLHASGDTGRILPIEIRNDSSATWQIEVFDTGTEIVRQFNIDETSTDLDPGNVAYLWNKNDGLWVNL